MEPHTMSRDKRAELRCEALRLAVAFVSSKQNWAWPVDAIVEMANGFEGFLVGTKPLQIKTRRRGKHA